MALIDTYIEELKSVRAAILKLTADPTTNQSVSSPNGGSFSASYVDLEKLHRREKELATLISELYRESIGLSSITAVHPIYCGG